MLHRERLLVERSLAKLARHYADEAVEEVFVNRPGEVVLKRGPYRYEYVADAGITYAYLVTACRVLANDTRRAFDPESQPILFTETPEGLRFTAMAGPNVKYGRAERLGACIAIRRVASRKRSLSEWNLDAEKLRASGRTRFTPDRQLHSGDPLEDLVLAVQNGEAVVVSGPTATGKTSFLRALIDEIPLDRRIVTAEDVRELDVPHPNHVHLIAERIQTEQSAVTWPRVIDVVKRLSPDAIICGEVSASNAEGVLGLMNTGHLGFLLTIHANSPEDAVRALYQNVVQVNPAIGYGPTVEIFRNAIGRVVQLSAEGGRRHIHAIDTPDLLDTVLTPELDGAVRQGT